MAVSHVWSSERNVLYVYTYEWYYCIILYIKLLNYCTSLCTYDLVVLDNTHFAGILCFELLKGCSIICILCSSVGFSFVCLLPTTVSTLCLRGLYLCKFSVLKFAAAYIGCVINFCRWNFCRWNFCRWLLIPVNTTNIKLCTAN